MEDFFVWKAGEVRSPDTIYQYRRWIGMLMDFTAHGLKDLTLADIGAFREFLAPRLSQQYIEHGIALIRHFLRYQNEVHGLRFPVMLLRHKEVRKKMRYVVSEGEYARMLEAAAGGSIKSLRDSVILRVLWDTGVRASELAEMELDRLLYEHDVPIGCIVLNKKNEGARPVYWSEETAWMMSAYLCERAQLKTVDRCVFVRLCYGYTHGGITRSTLVQIIRVTSNKAGLTNRVVTHSFRHAFIHRKSAEGRPDNVVAQMVGHKSPYMVMHYNALSRPELADAWGQSGLRTQAHRNEYHVQSAPYQRNRVLLRREKPDSVRPPFGSLR